VRPAAVADLLRSCVASGDFVPLADAYADGALLDATLPGARRKLRGPSAIVDALRKCITGPGRLVDWLPSVHPDGVAVCLEQVGGDGAVVRQRHYLRLEGGRVARHWLYAARPHTGAPDPPPAGDVAARLFAGLGPIAERTTHASSGWSGNRIDRLALEDGRALVAKRIVPGSDWLGRVSRDRGREALFHVEGTFGRLPAQVDPAVVAAEREGDAWWS
jgi:hypothetical protein